MKKFFDKPVQVRFRFDEETMRKKCRTYWFGIAYHDKVICGCCGNVFEVKECEEIIEYKYWIDIEEELGGKDDYCDSLKG